MLLLFQHSILCITIVFIPKRNLSGRPSSLNIGTPKPQQAKRRGSNPVAVAVKLAGGEDKGKEEMKANRRSLVIPSLNLKAEDTKDKVAITKKKDVVIVIEDKAEEEKKPAPSEEKKANRRSLVIPSLNLKAEDTKDKVAITKKKDVVIIIDDKKDSSSEQEAVDKKSESDDDGSGDGSDGEPGSSTNNDDGSSGNSGSDDDDDDDEDDQEDSSSSEDSSNSKEDSAENTTSEEEVSSSAIKKPFIPALSLQASHTKDGKPAKGKGVGIPPPPPPPPVPAVTPPVTIPVASAKRDSIPKLSLGSDITKGYTLPSTFCSKLEIFTFAFLVFV